VSAGSGPVESAARGTDPPGTDPPGEVIVYWRPGCGFCSGLLRGLERDGLDFERVDIWQDPDGAAFVRSVAGGNETVPTVRIGPVALVNPTRRDVMVAVAEHAPARLPADLDAASLLPPPGRPGRWFSR
jgi:mycoredoxin